MSVFSTEKTPSFEAKLESMIRVAQNRKKNLDALKESALDIEHKVAMESTLNKIDNDNSALESYNREIQRDKLSMARTNFLRSNAMSLLESNLYKKGYDKCYETAIFKIVYESFWADDFVKESTVHDMLDTYRNTIGILEKCGISKSKKDTKLVENIKESCGETAKKASKRIVNEIANDASLDEIESIDFTLNDDEATELDDNLASLGMDEITELIKKKVVNVINDEQEASAKKAEMFKDIDDNAQELADELNGADNEDETEDIEDDTEDEGTTESVIVQRTKTAKLNKLTGTSLFECINMHSIKDVDNHIVTEGISVTNDEVMDAAFMESVLTYTILETLQTLKLYEFNNSTVKVLKEHYRAN